MGKRIITAVLANLMLAGIATADSPRVVTDIVPVHGLVSRVMQGVGAPDVLVPPGASPHGYALRPSDAAALDAADLVFWIGHGLTPWLEDPLETLAGDAERISLLEAEGTKTLERREGAAFEAHHHHHDEHGDEDENHEEGEHHEDHAHEGKDAHHDEDEHHDEAAHHDDEGHEEAEAHGHHHDEEGPDPHVWLDPENGKLWLNVIAKALAEVDPDNAETYRANAAAGQADIDAASAQVAAHATDLGQFIVFHDAYQYFEEHFDIHASGAISIGDATKPGPARIEEIRNKVIEAGVTCVFSEPQFNQGLARTVIEGTSAKTAILDPLGTDIELGPDFYPALLIRVGENMTSCLK